MPEAEISDSDDLLEVIGRLRADFQQGGKLSLVWKCEKNMTTTQRNALHVWLEMLAAVLNDAGFDEALYFKQYAKQGFHVPFTKESVKRIFYKPTLDAMTGKKSSEDMSTTEPSEICKIVGAALADRLGVTPPAWPTRFGDG